MTKMTKKKLSIWKIKKSAISTNFPKPLKKKISSCVSEKCSEKLHLPKLM